LAITALSFSIWTLTGISSEAGASTNAQIGFVRGRSVFLASSDGAHVTAVLRGGLRHGETISYKDPAWSRTGRLAVTEEAQPSEGNETSSVIVVRPGHSPIGVPSGGMSCCDGSPAWAPNSRRIALVGLNYSEGGTLYITRVGSRATRPVARHSSVDDVQDDPAWSPDGRTIAYAENAQSRLGLFVIRPDGTRRRRLTRAPAHNPSWSPNGNWIVFDDGQQTIVTSIDGSRLRRLGPGTDPAWSPDEREIAYVRGNSIWVMDATGGHPRRVIPSATQPAWVS
jgi:Tol biopolymer transport system component